MLAISYGLVIVFLSWEIVWSTKDVIFCRFITDLIPFYVFFTIIYTIENILQ